MKRDNWKNEEVIEILEGLKILKRDDDEVCSWNLSLEVAIAQFYDFKRPADQYAAMAYCPDTKDILVIGPKLPR